MQPATEPLDPHPVLAWFSQGLGDKYLYQLADNPLNPVHCPRRGTADGQRAGSARGGVRLHPGTRIVSAGGRDAGAGPGAAWAVAVLYGTAAVAHGASARGHPATPGATGPRPRARGHRPLCPRVDVVLPWRVAGGPPAPGGKHRTLHAGPAPRAGVPHGPRSGGWVPSSCRSDPLVAGIPGASSSTDPRSPGVGTRAIASL